jgi:microcystin degradation protein MlrC
MEPSSIGAFGLNPDDFKVFAVKSRVHFRRGFDDSGYAKTILLVEPPEPFLGTVRLEGLPYQNVDLTKFYPYGDPVFP